MPGQRKDSSLSGVEVRPGFHVLPPGTNLLKRLFCRYVLPGHRDPRKTKREDLSGLIAYFFTGGTPVPFKVRDVGPSGLYLYTDERWSVGTVLRLALTDVRLPSLENSLTVNARVMRWGKDGMGFKFVPYDAKMQDRDLSVGQDWVATTEKEIREFIDRIKGNAA